MSDKVKNKDPFNKEVFKRGIAFVESNNGKNMWNKTSSATGKYQFLYNEIKNLPEMKGVTREQFRDNPKLQEEIMDLAVQGKLKNRPGYYKNANDLSKEYKKEFGSDWNYRPDNTIQAQANKAFQAPKPDSSIDWLQGYVNNNEFANGGKIPNCGGPGQPSCNEEVKNMTQAYIKSPKYKERLKSSNYTNVNEEIKQRLENVNNTEVKHNNKEDSNYKDKIISLNKKQALEENVDLKSILAHEFGHSELDQNKESYNYRNVGIKDTRLNTYDNMNLKHRLKKGVNKKNSHNSFPDENKSDLNALRYETRDFYDAGKQDFTKEYLDKAENSLIKERLLKNYSEKDLIWLMNNIASNNQTDKNINVASNGGFLNQFSKGGNLNNNNMNSENLLTEFNTGGSHEQNPNGGIPQGMGANGQMNTVEEGETKKGDYVFSDRIKLTPELIKKYALPKNFKGKTMADASKKLNESFKETNSKIDRETTEEMIGRLTEASEEARITEELANMPDEHKKQLGGMLNHQNQMFLGGSQGFKESQFSAGLQEGATGEQIAGTVGTGLGAASTAMELGNTAFGPTGIDTSGATQAPDVKVGEGIASGAMKGASAGMAFGPWGAAIGGVVGGAAGWVGGAKAKKDATEAATNFDLAQNAQHKNTYSHGGKIDPTKDKSNPQRNETKNIGGTPEQLALYQDKLKDKTDGFNFGKYGGLNYFNAKVRDDNNVIVSNSEKYHHNYDAMKNSLSELQKVNPGINITMDWNNYSHGGKMNQYPNGGRPTQYSVNELNPYGITSLADNSINATLPENGLLPDYTQPGAGTYAKAAWNTSKDFLNENGADMLRYAPVAANALQLNNLKKPEQESLDRLDSRYKPDYVDEKQMVNRASSDYNNVANSLKSATNGSVGALRTNLLAAHMNRTKGLSDSFLQADNINRGQNQMAQQFNNSNDRVNIQQSNTEKDINARNRAAYDNEKSKFIGQIGTDLGNIGLEQLRKKYPERMGLGYNYKGQYSNS